MYALCSLRREKEKSKKNTKPEYPSSFILPFDFMGYEILFSSPILLVCYIEIRTVEKKTSINLLKSMFLQIEILDH